MEKVSLPKAGLGLYKYFLNVIMGGMVEEQAAEQTDRSSEDSMSPVQKTLFGLVAIVILALVGMLISANQTTKQEALETENDTMVEEVAGVETVAPTPTPEAMTEVTELKIEDKVVGTGEVVKAGDTVSVNYTGTLLDGTQFDSSLDEGRTPFIFTVGAGAVIEGWDVGLVGMQVGGTRMLTIPAAMAYGDVSPSPLIPANSPLVFEIVLLEITN